MQPITLFNFPRAILHIDGDSFFASCEVAKNPKLRGKPVVTGMERGIVSSMTYEAKRMGVTRAMSLPEVRKVCPGVVILPSDYETYSLFSVRMYAIVRRYTLQVEEYSIDECFADLTGLRRPLGMSYEEMAARIKYELDSELGITFSIGLAPTKVLAKIGSKYKKPSGLTIIRGKDIHLFLQDTAVGKVWGIGPQTMAYLNKLGVRTALDLALKNKDWVKAKLTKPHYEIWQELRGEAAHELELGKKHNYRSISKTKTFTPPSSSKSFVFSQLSKNIENACIKLRRHKLETNKIFFYLKTQSYRHYGAEIKLSDYTVAPNEILNASKECFDKIYDPNMFYRATGIVLCDLDIRQDRPLDLFGRVAVSKKIAKVFTSLDEMAKKYGKHALFLGTSLEAMKSVQHKNDRATSSERKLKLFKGETARKRLYLPMLGEVK